jgi:antirestriction protein ArdC
MNSKLDLYQAVTDNVIKLMTEHGANWTNPFNRKGAGYQAVNAVTGEAYKGVNQLLLGVTPYPLALWAGFGQWQAKGCTVKKGEKATIGLYFNVIQKTKTDTAGETKTTSIPLLKYFNVFNIDQVEGAFAEELRARVNDTAGANTVAALDNAEAFFNAQGATVTHSNTPRACYNLVSDNIHMPNKALFEDTKHSTATECYYSTLAHEFIHWTGAPARLKRDHSGRFGSQAYAFEELVAELGAAFLCAELGISTTTRADHAEYLNNWLQVLKNDNKAIIKAATLSKAACLYLHENARPQACAA